MSAFSAGRNLGQCARATAVGGRLGSLGGAQKKGGLGEGVKKRTRQGLGAASCGASCGGTSTGCGRAIRDELNALGACPAICLAGAGPECTVDGMGKG
jgi:hypothetical protein